jgi:Arc/MetJ family transcription regulator
MTTTEQMLVIRYARRQMQSIALPRQARQRLFRADLCRLMCKESHMATNLAIDPDLLDRALEVSGERTKKAVVTKALQEFIARREQKRVIELMGQLEWDDSFNYKAERSRS